MAETFQNFIARDRERLHAEREAIFNQQHELEGKLAAINSEMRAIDAYEAAKSGKAAPLHRFAVRLQCGDVKTKHEDEPDRWKDTHEHM